MTQTFHKTVDIKTVDDEARTATGAVLVPNELDHQQDFLRPDAVERFHAETPDTGVMHSAFPADAADLERNEVIDEAEEIGDETFPPGTWVATRRYEDDDLWQLVSDGVLTGFSIGGEISRAAEHDDLPSDVRVPDSVDHEGGGTELLAGQVNEVSDVDIPAVPRASYKGADMGKALLDEVDSEAEFVELMTEQRGHDEDDARQLYQYLTDVRETKRRDALDKVGKPFESPEGAEFEDFEECVETLMDDGMSREEAEVTCGAWQDESKHNDTMTDSDNSELDDATKLQVIKSWLTGSDDDVSPESGQSEATSKASDDEDDDDEDDEEEMNNDKSADMTNDDTSEPPEWAKSLTDTVEQIDERVDKLEGDDESEDAGKMDDAPEWAQDLAEKVDDLDERVDAISKQSGHSQQLDAAEKDADDNLDKVDEFKKGLVGGR